MVSPQVIFYLHIILHIYPQPHIFLYSCLYFYGKQTLLPDIIAFQNMADDGGIYPLSSPPLEPSILTIPLPDAFSRILEDYLEHKLA